MPIRITPFALALLRVTTAPAHALDGELDCFRPQPAIAEPPPLPVRDWVDPDPLPSVRQAGNVRYMTGGIGANSAEAMRGLRARYPVNVTFALRDAGKNQFTAGVGVVIEDASGVPLLSVVTEGPYLYVDLPPGQYRLRAQEPRLGPPQDKVFRVQARRHVDLMVLWQVRP